MAQTYGVTTNLYARNKPLKKGPDKQMMDAKMLSVDFLIALFRQASYVANSGHYSNKLLDRVGRSV